MLIVFGSAPGIKRWTLNKLLQGAGPGADPTEIDASAGLPDYAAGDVLEHSADIARPITLAAWTLIKSIEISRSGTLRIKFSLKGWGDDTGIAHGQINRNGTPVGIDQTREPNSHQVFSEDIGGWTRGDFCQLYCKINGQSGETMNFRLYEALGMTPNTITD